MRVGIVSSMPLYAVLIYAADSLHAPDATSDDLAEPNAHGDELAASGSMRAAYAFTPRSMARSVRVGGITDGPFIDAEHAVAGFYVLDAPDLESALAIARTNPAVDGSGGVEVRPIHSGGPIG
jgi:hypothetical protein